MCIPNPVQSALDHIAMIENMMLGQILQRTIILPELNQLFNGHSTIHIPLISTTVDTTMSV